jgi:hypothetical protein
MSLSTRRVLEESTSIALILLVWAVLSVLTYAVGTLQFGLQLAGLTMAVLYAVVRGVRLAPDADPAYDDPDAESVLRENGRALLAGAPWFAVAFVLAALIHGVVGFDLVVPGPFALSRVAAGTFVQVFAVTGVVTVLLVAVATGTRALRSVRTL